MRIEVDELWSFVGGKQQVWWVWVALDSRTRQVVAMVVGERDEYTARCLWEALPAEAREVVEEYLEAHGVRQNETK